MFEIFFLKRENNLEEGLSFDEFLKIVNQMVDMFSLVFANQLNIRTYRGKLIPKRITIESSTFGLQSKSLHCMIRQRNGAKGTTRVFNGVKRYI